MTKIKTAVAPVVACFTRKAAAEIYLNAPVKGRAEVAARIKAQAAKNQKRAWKTLVRYIEAADMVRIKLVVSGTREEWAAINADAIAKKGAGAAVKAVKAVAKTRAKKPTKEQRLIAQVELEVGRADRLAREAKPVVADGGDAVAAAKAYAVLLSAGMGNSPEAGLIASFLRG
tara:strand:- start:1155 stop:1673 length:519 start_codon:yes stop_codon:yes gene_type:complete